MTECEKIISMIDDYIDKELSEEECKEVKNHLEVCPSCKDEYDFKLSICESAKKIELPEPPAGFGDMVMEKIKKQKKKTFFSPRNIGTVAACLVVAVVLGVSGELDNKKTQKNEFYPVAVSDETFTVISPDISEESAASPRMVSPEDNATSEALKTENVFYIDEENFAFAKEIGKICGVFNGDIYKMEKDSFIVFIQTLADMGAKIEFDFSMEDEIIFKMEKM